MANAKRSTKKKTTRKAPAKKTEAPVQAAPVRLPDRTGKNGQAFQNSLGRSESLNQACEAITVLTAHHYHRLLSKYHNDGEILAQLPGLDESGDAIPIEPVTQLTQDLAALQELLLLVNNLQRIRSDEAIDIKKNPFGPR